MTTASALKAEAADLRALVKRHKEAIRRHRAELGTVAARLAWIETECRRRGIALIVHPAGVGEDVHGRDTHTQY